MYYGKLFLFLMAIIPVWVSGDVTVDDPNVPALEPLNDPYNQRAVWVWDRNTNKLSLCFDYDDRWVCSDVPEKYIILLPTGPSV